MESDFSYYADLVNRYFTGEISAGEISELIHWLKLSDSNKTYFEEQKKLFTIINDQAINENIDTTKEWELLKERIKAQTITPETGSSESEKYNERLHISKYIYIKNNISRFLKIAAIIIFVSIISFITYQYFKPSQVQHIVAEEGITEKALPDGSSVTLNKGAALDFAKDFSGSYRTATLKGEAYFNITHDTARPFIVAAGDIRVEVTGTSFYVNSEYKGNNVEVVLTSGSVAVYKADEIHNKVILTPGERAVYMQANNIITKSINTDSNYMAFKTRKLVFDNTPLQDVIYNMNRVYHANIRITDTAVSNCLVTTTIDASKLSIDEALDVLNATLYINIKKNKDSVDISGKSCK